MTALTPDRTVLDIEDIDSVDQSEVCDDFAEDFVDIRLRMSEKNKKFGLPLNVPARSQLNCFFSSTSLGWSDSMRAGKLEAAMLGGCLHPGVC